MRVLLCVLCTLWAQGVQARCVELKDVVDAVVGIHRFDKEKELQGGTAWFLSPTMLETNAHVVRFMELDRTWKMVDVRHSRVKGKSEVVKYVYARLHEYGGKRAELADSSKEVPVIKDTAVVEFREPLQGFISLSKRSEKPKEHEEFLSLGYTDYKLASVRGRAHLQFDSKTLERVPDESAQQLLYLEANEGEDRLALTYGASGAPIVDCKGKVVGTMTLVIRRLQTIQMSSGKERVEDIPTLPGRPTMAAVPYYKR